MSRGARDMGITCRQTVGQEWHQSSTKSEQHPLCTTPARAWETQPRHSPMESRDTNHAFEAPCPIPLPLLCNMVEAAAAAWDAFEAGAYQTAYPDNLEEKKSMEGHGKDNASQAMHGETNTLPFRTGMFHHTSPYPLLPFCKQCKNTSFSNSLLPHKVSPKQPTKVNNCSPYPSEKVNFPRSSWIQRIIEWR